MPAGFFKRQAVGAHDLFGQLVTAEGEVARVDDLQVAQHAERGAGGSEIDQRDIAVDAAIGHLVRHQAAGVFQREGLDIDDAGLETGSRHRGAHLFDVLAA